MIIKLGILQDEKFYERSKDFLIWKNLKGEWTTVGEYLERNIPKQPGGSGIGQECRPEFEPGEAGAEAAQLE